MTRRTAVDWIQSSSLDLDSPTRILARSQLRDLEPPVWLVDDFIMEDSVAVLYGPPGHYKSTIAIGLACAIATGEPFAGRAVQQGAVIYISGEGVSAIPERIEAWEMHRKRLWKQAGEVGDTPGIVDDLLGVHRGAVTIDDPDDLVTFLDDARRFALVAGPIRLVVVDTLARCLGGAENEARAMGEFVMGLDAIRTELGAAVLVIHHGSKQGSGPRGSSALSGAIDTQIGLRSGTRDDLVILHCEKQRLAAEFEDIPLAIERVDLEVHLDEPDPGRTVVDTKPVAVLVSAEEDLSAGMPARKPLSANQRKVMEVLEGANGEARDVTSIRHEASLTSRQWDRARSALLDLDLIEEVGRALYRLKSQEPGSSQPASSDSEG